MNRQATGRNSTEITDSGDVVTKSKSLGTTADKIGYSWRSAGSVAGLEKRQGSKDSIKLDGGNVVTVSKSQGTTDDRVGYSWRSVGL